MVTGKSTESATTFILRNVSIDLADLTEQVVDRIGRAGAMDFILALDAAAADYDFTVTLRDKLNEELAKEDAAAEKVHGNPTEQFLRWLVRMDDPADEQGVKDRQTVRLSTIIDRARDLLGGA
jgi:leucyl aminopeptidase (aminopeptidase T)